MRGQESLESATRSSAAFCLSFLNTASVPAIAWLERYYNCDVTADPVAYGAISTEHSVMCSNYTLDGDACIDSREVNCTDPQVLRLLHRPLSEARVLRGVAALLRWRSSQASRRSVRTSPMAHSATHTPANQANAGHWSHVM